MRRFTLSALPLLLLLSWSGCSDDDGNTVTADASVLKRYGKTCAADSECATKMCANKTCTIACTTPASCPTVDGTRFHCGEVTTGKFACYAQTWDGVKAGTMGTECSSTGKCGTDHKCTGQEGDADRYCASKCASELECPPQYRCAATQQGNKAAETTKYCLRRDFCHPCSADWQCPGAGTKCVKDKLGNSFCSKSCSPASSSPDAGSGDAAPGGTCPTYATCAKVGSEYFCQHKAGFCNRGFDSKGAQCDPCINHGWMSTGDKSDLIQTVAEVGQCKTGHYCVMYDRYYGETACLKSCTVDGDCGSSKEKCFAAKTSLGGSVCKPWENYVYGGKTYQVAAACPFK